MEDMQKSKRRRVYSFEPNAVVCADFAHKYVGYLLPALAKATSNYSSCHGAKDRKVKKTIRFEVDMALVLSSSGFKWSRALRNKLEHGHPIVKSIDSSSSKCNGIAQRFHLLRPRSVVPRPLALVSAVRPRSVSRMSCSNKIRDDDAFGQQMRTLRRILPGGSEMRLNELLTEVKSYMVCLQLQVNILRTLVEIH